MKPKHYLNVISDGPPMILRVPWPMPRWRDILRATTAVMRSHGLRQKDIYALEGFVDIPSKRTDEDREFAGRVDAGCVGFKTMVSTFWLYDWHRGAFKLARSATDKA